MANAYQVSKPYPTPSGLGCNKRTGRRLLEVYCGQTSELTLVTQLAYHQSESQQINGEVAQTLQGICRVDLQHLTMLGSCIRQVGVRPLYRTINSGQPVLWNACYDSYRNNIREMIAADIQTKEKLVQKYNRLIGCVQNTQITALLYRICEDELLHIQLLTNLLNTYY